jgi:hypothetical protein
LPNPADKSSKLHGRPMDMIQISCDPIKISSAHRLLG